MAVHTTAGEALARAKWAVGRMGLPQPWAPFGQRDPEAADGTVNDCCFFFTWCLKDNGGRARSDYRNGSIKALRADRKWAELHGVAKGPDVPLGAGILLRWSDSGLPDHIGMVVGYNESNDTFKTIEANTGPRVGVYAPAGVYNRTRFRANIVGFILPPYLTESESK